mgnify:CR=1 FL=1
MYRESTKRVWAQKTAYYRCVAKVCQEFTDCGWVVFSVTYTDMVGNPEDSSEVFDGAIVVAYRDDGLTLNLLPDKAVLG